MATKKQKIVRRSLTPGQIALIVAGIVALCCIVVVGGLYFLMSRGIVRIQGVEVSPINVIETSTDTVATLENACIAVGGHQGWVNGPKNLEWLAILNRAKLEGDGLSMQPEILAAFGKTNIKILGFTPPADFEALNDGVQSVACFDDNGNIVEVWVMDRTGELRLSFWDISYIQLKGNRLQTWINDTDNYGGWTGKPEGTNVTYSDPFDSWESARSFAGDMNVHFEKMIDLSLRIKSGEFTLPEYGIVVETWDKSK